jgi:protein-disulfide isomerase
LNNKPKRNADAEKDALATVDKRANRKALYTIGAILIAGAAVGVWLNRSSSPAPVDSANAQSTGKVSVADLMAPGPLPDQVLGNKDAKVTIVEYASMTCPHCASFHSKVYGELKTKYVDTGKVRFIFREFPLDSRAAAASMLARCVPGEQFFPLIKVLFDRQEQWAFTKGSPVAELKNITKQAGMTEEAFEKCINDKELLGKVEQTRNTAADKFGVTSTPTFFINGEKLKGAQDLAAFDKAIEPLLK